MSPPVKREKVLVSSHLQQNRGQKPLREGEHQEGETGAQGLPSFVLPSEASQLPPLSPPPDLAAVYSYAVTRKSRRTPGQRRCPHATPDWLGPSPSHCPTPPPLLGPPPPPPPSPASGFAAARLQSQSGRPRDFHRRLSSGPVPAVQIRKLRLIRREVRRVLGLIAP